MSSASSGSPSEAVNIENIEIGRQQKKVGFSNGGNTHSNLPKPLPTGGIYTYPAADPSTIIKPGFSTVDTDPETILGNSESDNTYNRTINAKVPKAKLVKELQNLYRKQFTKEQLGMIRNSVQDFRKTPNVLAHYRGLNHANLTNNSENSQSIYGVRKSVRGKVSPAAKNIWGNAAFAPTLERTRKRKSTKSRKSKRRASRKLLH